MNWSRILANLVCIAVVTTAHAEMTGGGFTATGSDTTARFFHDASVLPNGRVLVSGGTGLQLIPPSLISLDDLSFYDPGTGTFSSSYVPTGGGPAVTPSLTTPRSNHTQTTLPDGRVLIAGGLTGAAGTSPGSPIADVEVFDPATGLVTPGPPMNVARADHTATHLPDGRVLVAGGATWQMFQPGVDQWSAAVPLARSRAAHAAVLLADHGEPGAHRVLLIAGQGNGAATMEIVDPDGGVSTMTGVTLDVGVDDLAAVQLDDGSVLIVGGQNLQGGDTVELSYLYDPIGDTISPAPPPPGQPDGVADHLLVGLGRYAFLIGGERQVAGVDTELSIAMVFDRLASDWTFNMGTIFPHDDAAAVVLPGERILVIDGGVRFFGQEAPSTNVELFTPDDTTGADVNCDGVIDVVDLVAVILNWGECPPGDMPCVGDTNDDATVDVQDLLTVIMAWTTRS